MLLNNRGVMRTFEAIIAAVIMILGISFILNSPGATYSVNPSWEVLNAKNTSEDILVVLEKSGINNESLINQFINNPNSENIKIKLDSLIPPGYTYKFDIYSLENMIFIETFGESVKDGVNLSNGYVVGNSLQNNSMVWKYHQSENGWPGEYNLYFPNGNPIKIYAVLIVDQIDEVLGYDTVYLNLEDVDFTSSSTKLSSSTPFKVGDILEFESQRDGVSYNYTYQISNIAKDGNSISFALIDETIYIDFPGINTKTVSIFNQDFRFILNEAGSVDNLTIERKISEPSIYATYLDEIKENNWVYFLQDHNGLGYRGKINLISYKGTSGYIAINLVPFRDNIAHIERPGEYDTAISSKRIVSLSDPTGTRAYYVSLIMGREKLWIIKHNFLSSQLC